MSPSNLVCKGCGGELELRTEHLLWQFHRIDPATGEITLTRALVPPPDYSPRDWWVVCRHCGRRAKSCYISAVGEFYRGLLQGKRAIVERG